MRPAPVRLAGLSEGSGLAYAPRSAAGAAQTLAVGPAARLRVAPKWRIFRLHPPGARRPARAARPARDAAYAGAAAPTLDRQAKAGRALLTRPARVGAGNGTRRAELAGALLGHYLAAVRVARRAVAQAKEQGRLSQPGKGWEMTVWFCRQVQDAWSAPKWARVEAAMCAAREPSERGLVELRPFGPSQSRGGKARGRKQGKT